MNTDRREEDPREDADSPSDVDEVEAGEVEPGSRSDEVERAQEREEEATEG